MIELVENRLYDYADDSILLVVVLKPADRPDVAASLNGDFHGKDTAVVQSLLHDIES